MQHQRSKSLLIFDLDGTLIDSVPDLAEAINIMLAKLGKPLHTEANIRHWVGNGSRILVKRALVGNAQVREEALVDVDVAHAEHLFFAAYAKNCAQKTQAYPGVHAGLKRLASAGFTLTLVTNKPARFVPLILRHCGWQETFALNLGGDSLPSKKPDPAPLLHVCQTLGFSTEQAYMIGDSKNDIWAGQRAGIDTLGVSYGYNYGLDIRAFDPTLAFDCFAELTEYLCSTQAQ